MTATIDQQFIEYIVKSLVGHPDAVKVERRIDEKGVLLELTVDPEDLGRVIGKRGATAQSLRTLLRALGTKNEARFNLKIIDNGVHEPRQEGSQESSEQAEKPVVKEKTESKKHDEFFENNDDQPRAEIRDSLADRTRRELADLDDLDL